MKASKVLVNILLMPLAVALLLVVLVLCVVSVATRAVLSVPYRIFNGIAMGCQALLRSFVEGYEKGRPKVIGEVSHEIRH